MNILITGARGFMGKNLRSALTGRCGDAHRLMLLDMPHTEEELLAAAAEADPVSRAELLGVYLGQGFPCPFGGGAFVVVIPRRTRLP